MAFEIDRAQSGRLKHRKLIAHKLLIMGTIIEGYMNVFNIIALLIIQAQWRVKIEKTLKKRDIPRPGSTTS